MYSELMFNRSSFVIAEDNNGLSISLSNAGEVDVHIHANGSPIVAAEHVYVIIEEAGSEDFVGFAGNAAKVITIHNNYSVVKFTIKDIDIDSKHLCFSYDEIGCYFEIVTKGSCFFDALAAVVRCSETVSE